MIYYSMSINISSSIAADTPKGFAERLNNAPDQHAGVRVAVYGCGEGALHIAAAINAMRGDPKSHTHAVPSTDKYRVKLTNKSTENAIRYARV